MEEERRERAAQTERRNIAEEEIDGAGPFTKPVFVGV